MRITHLRIKDFRNIVFADIDLHALNILTGKNSSGKTNFLLALSQALSQEKDYSEKFANNTVTLHQGKDSATISATIGNIQREVCYIYNNEDRFLCLNPEGFRFEKVIGKNSLSKVHRLYYSGKFYSNDSSKGIKWELFKGKKDHYYQRIEDELVYQESFFKETEKGPTKIVTLEKSTSPHQEDYLRYLSSLNSVLSWVGKNDAFYSFVTERGTRETYDQVTNRLKVRPGEFLNRQSFDKAKFIFLLADLQRHKEQYGNFQMDLRIYTNGIVSDMYITEKGATSGEMRIDSPNGPSDIWTISSGTSILVFFVLLSNWLRLPESYKSYQTPNIMIFDEVDSLVHPSLMEHFKELLEITSKSIQIFLSTHSPYFLDGFHREQIFLLKDTPSLAGSKRITANRCNIYSYEQIIRNAPKHADAFADKKNSELFVEGMIDMLFPNRGV